MQRILSLLAKWGEQDDPNQERNQSGEKSDFLKKSDFFDN
jgi:hypothetical protein